MQGIADAGRRLAGKFLVVVGPDGVGKSTFASAVLRMAGPEGRYFHFRPPLHQLDQEVPAHAAPPKRIPGGGKLAGWARIVIALIRFWAGYWLAIRPELRRGSVVVGDRWAYGYLVQPLPLGFFGPAWLAEAVIRLLPTPDIVVNLAAPAETIRSRKTELEYDEIISELAAWQLIPAPLLTLDATWEPERLVVATAEQLR